MTPNSLVFIVLLLMFINWSIYYYFLQPSSTNNWYDDFIQIFTLNGKLNPFKTSEVIMPIEKEEVKIELPPVTEQKEEVYNIDENEFTYSDAKTLCKAFGGKLATYGQVIDAQKKGANWCNYGWSENQMALFPIQEDYHKKIQSDPSTKDTCGEPGVNGGYFDDPNLRFGVNCFGIKPNPDESKIVYSQDGKEIDVLDTEQMILDKYKSKIASGEIEPRPFSSNLWSEFSHKKSVYYLTPNTNKTIEITKGPNDEDKLNLSKVDTLKNNLFTQEQLERDVL